MKGIQIIKRTLEPVAQNQSNLVQQNQMPNKKTMTILKVTPLSNQTKGDQSQINIVEQIEQSPQAPKAQPIQQPVKKEGKITGDHDTIKNIKEQMMDFEQQRKENSEMNRYIMSYKETELGYNRQVVEYTIKGIKDTLYEGKLVRGYLKIYDGFPTQGPDFYFHPINNEALIHLNVYGDSLMCIPMLRYWDSSKTLTEIFASIDYILHNANDKNPANFNLAGESLEKRQEVQKQQAKFLANDPDY